MLIRSLSTLYSALFAGVLFSPSLLLLMRVRVIDSSARSVYALRRRATQPRLDRHRHTDRVPRRLSPRAKSAHWRDGASWRSSAPVLSWGWSSASRLCKIWWRLSSSAFSSRAQRCYRSFYQVGLLPAALWPFARSPACFPVLFFLCFFSPSCAAAPPSSPSGTGSGMLPLLQGQVEGLVAPGRARPIRRRPPSRRTHAG